MVRLPRSSNASRNPLCYSTRDPPCPALFQIRASTIISTHICSSVSVSTKIWALWKPGLDPIIRYSILTIRTIHGTMNIFVSVESMKPKQPDLRPNLPDVKPQWNPERGARAEPLGPKSVASSCGPFGLATSQHSPWGSEWWALGVDEIMGPESQLLPESAWLRFSRSYNLLLFSAAGRPAAAHTLVGKQRIGICISNQRSD